MKNGHSRDTNNIGHTRHSTVTYRTIRKTQNNTENLKDEQDGPHQKTRVFPSAREW